eukprot:gene21015-23067_t
MRITNPNKVFNVATLNTRGLKSTEKRTTLADDMRRYQIQIMAIQETHLQGTDTLEIKTSDGKHNYDLFHTGSDSNKYHGVAIVCEKGLKANFQNISNLLCKAVLKIENRRLVFISCYTPTLQNSEKNPQEREEFYDSLHTAIQNVNSRDLLIIGGDLNAKTGTGWSMDSKVMGKFGKGKINSNGTHLLDTLELNELFLTNTCFDHKKCHRTTWECPERINPHKDADGNVRRNIYRNQIDYVIMKQIHKALVQDSRSYSGLKTQTDHRIVRTKLRLDWHKAYQTKQIKDNIDYDKLNLPQYKMEYQTKLINLLEEANQSETPQEIWDIITT